MVFWTNCVCGRPGAEVLSTRVLRSALRGPGFWSKPGTAAGLHGLGLYIISRAGPGPTYCGPGSGLC